MAIKDLKEDKWVQVGENCLIQVTGNEAYIKVDVSHRTGEKSKSGISDMVTPGISSNLAPGVKFTFNVYAPLPKDQRPKKA